MCENWRRCVARSTTTARCARSSTFTLCNAPLSTYDLSLRHVCLFNSNPTLFVPAIISSQSTSQRCCRVGAHSLRAALRRRLYSLASLAPEHSVSSVFVKSYFPNSHCCSSSATALSRLDADRRVVLVVPAFEIDLSFVVVTFRHVALSEFT